MTEQDKLNIEIVRRMYIGDEEERRNIPALARFCNASRQAAEGIQERAPARRP